LRAILRDFPIVAGWQIHVGRIWLLRQKGAHAEKLHCDCALCVSALVRCTRRGSANLQAVSRSAPGDCAGEQSLPAGNALYGQLPRDVPDEGINIVSITCAKTVPGGVKDFELCARSRDNNGVFVKLADAGNSECVKPLAEQKND